MGDGFEDNLSQAESEAYGYDELSVFERDMLDESRSHVRSYPIPALEVRRALSHLPKSNRRPSCTAPGSNKVAGRCTACEEKANELFESLLYPSTAHFCARCREFELEVMANLPS